MFDTQKRFQASDYRLTSALFLRLLALIYLSAFASTGVQIVGLVGADGILPFAQELVRVANTTGPERYWLHPTLFWISASDTVLQGVSLAGAILSVLLFLNILPRMCLVLLFVLYLSLYHAGQIFFEFQWDYLLLECGFLALFLPGGSPLTVWLYRWLLFRLRFFSGLAKLLSQDPSWASLTALFYFFETQPLPHWGGWHAHHLPDWFLRFGTGSALFVELVVPFMTFLPRPWRISGAWVTILMQVLILLTSNHNYANFLILALCLFLLDDRAVGRVIPGPVTRWLLASPASVVSARPVRSALLGVFVGLVVFISTVDMWERVFARRAPEPLAAIIDGVKPFRIVNNYHAFPNMLTERLELIIEGSVDATYWTPYEFKYKPGDPNRRPEFIVPHQPRLDWLTWFVPWHPMFLPWFERFLYRLLENSPAVTDLMARNPFADQPARYIRVTLYRYRFADPDTRRTTGRWWIREYLGPFTPLPWVGRKEITSSAISPP